MGGVRKKNIDSISRGAAPAYNLASIGDTAAMMDEIREMSVPADGLALWALGQSGFAMKPGDGPLVCIDPCLADPVAKLNPAWSRLYPPPIEPEALACDVLVITHDHLDHLDPDTISRLTPDAVGMFVGPGNACRHLATLGVAEDRICRLDASQTLTLNGLELTGTLAVTNDATQPDAEGVLLRFANGLTVYHTGDTAFTPLLAHVASQKPDLYIPCINGRYGNMDAFEAAVLGACLRAKWAVPHHFDMFKDNLADPAHFVAAMADLAGETECVALKPGQMHLFDRSTEA